MTIESYISDWNLPRAELRRCPGKGQRSSSEANLPPTMIGELGSDLLEEILIRLPDPRSTSRCKLVCKRWGSMISSPRFNRRFVSHHQARNPSHPPMPADPYELVEIILSFLPPVPGRVRHYLRVLDCNKDLVLCGFWDLDCDDGELSRLYLVCNPFTKQWIALPLAPSKQLHYKSAAARVACIYQVMRPSKAVKLDVFCSESGEWIKEALVCPDHFGTILRTISCNGEMFWQCIVAHGGPSVMVAACNPFRLDLPPTLIDASAFLEKPRWYISGSQGVLHVIAIEIEDRTTLAVRSSIWRLEDNRKSWTKQCEWLVNKRAKCRDYGAYGCYQASLHPHNPEIVFFKPFHFYDVNVILCCNLRREELEFIAEVDGSDNVCRLQVFEPRSSCWATPIPRYEKLQGMHDISYDFWVQISREAKTPSLPPFTNKYMKEIMKASLPSTVSNIHKLHRTTSAPSQELNLDRRTKATAALEVQWQYLDLRKNQRAK
ncbi:unnamed protein product [Linum trigynum]|uniref:F-box domain-containing protein n=1 Tax=Linum trigynum TaxID=586398 RepID=A0AAV2C9F1_9ROSI